MSLHSFDPEIASRVGVNAAVMYQNILFWAEKNKANRRHIIDGLVWTYNSRRAFSELFSYLTESQVKTALGKLVECGLLVKGDYNLANYDKTSWYAPAVSAEWINSAIGQKSPMDWSKTANGLAENHQPIPDIKPVNKPDSKLSCKIDDAFAEFWTHYPRKAGKAAAAKAFTKAAKKHCADDILFGLSQQIEAMKAKDTQFIPHAATWLNAERWNDEPEQPTGSDHQAQTYTRGDAKFDEARERALRIGSRPEEPDPIGF
jgi:hypothetical protein